MTVTGISGDELIALGHAAIAKSHELILLGGVLGVLSIVAGLISRRVGAPMLLVFLALGMLAGEDGLLGIPYDDFTSAYLIGSVALAVILFEGGLKTPVSMLRLAFWPAAVLATIGVALTAAILGIFVSLVDGVPLLGALLAGSAAAPTDAAAVAVLLRRAGAALPERLLALLEIESGLNDPMVGIPYPAAVTPYGRTRLYQHRRSRTSVLRGNDGGCGLRPGRRLAARAVAEAPALGSLARTGAGAHRRACRVRTGSAAGHQWIPRNLPRRRSNRRDPGTARVRRSSTSSKEWLGSHRLYCS